MGTQLDFAIFDFRGSASLAMRSGLIGHADPRTRGSAWRLANAANRSTSSIE